mmetsp:Transcript_79794/g.214386  ORF Transcript_79794/g.214386 Transcript_79794/m.214386 type:complete len:216 (+) Transcript_79794:278-925(+)
MRCGTLATSRSTLRIILRCFSCASAAASRRTRATAALMGAISSTMTSGATFATRSMSMRSKSSPTAWRQRAYCLWRQNRLACRSRSTVHGRASRKASHSLCIESISYSLNHSTRKSTLLSLTSAARAVAGCRNLRNSSNSAFDLPGSSTLLSAPSFMPLPSILAKTGEAMARMADETWTVAPSMTTSMMPRSTEAAMGAGPAGGGSVAPIMGSST